MNTNRIIESLNDDADQSNENAGTYDEADSLSSLRESV